VTRLPVLAGDELVRILGRFGYDFDRQTGSHVILRYGLPPHRRVTVPLHRAIAKGTLRAILRHTGITVEQLLERR
jgi:predicted RNA binding protein YcfA (HicA-like mRNA interferase family)